MRDYTTDAERMLASGEPFYLESFGYVGAAIVEAPRVVRSMADCVDGVMILRCQMKGETAVAHWMLLRGQSPRWRSVGEITAVRPRREEEWELACASH